MGAVCLDNQLFSAPIAAIPSYATREPAGKSREEAILLSSDDESAYDVLDGQSDTSFPSISELCLAACDDLDSSRVTHSDKSCPHRDVMESSREVNQDGEDASTQQERTLGADHLHAAPSATYLQGVPGPSGEQHKELDALSPTRITTHEVDEGSESTTSSKDAWEMSQTLLPVVDAQVSLRPSLLPAPSVRPDASDSPMRYLDAASHDACDGADALPQASPIAAVRCVELPIGFYRPCRSIESEWDKVTQSNGKPGSPSPLQYPNDIAQGTAKDEAGLRQVTPRQSRNPATSRHSVADSTGDGDDKEAETGGETGGKTNPHLFLGRRRYNRAEVEDMDIYQHSEGSNTDRNNIPHDSMASDRGYGDESERSETRQRLTSDDQEDLSSQRPYPVPTTPPTRKLKRRISGAAVRCRISADLRGPRKQAEAARQSRGKDSPRHHRRRRQSTAELEDGGSYCPSDDEAQQDEDSDGPPLPPRKRRKPSSFTRSPPSQAADRQLADLGQPRPRSCADKQTLSMDREDSGHNGDLSRASFEEWPLNGAVLKRTTVDGVTTFQLQFTWSPCTDHKQTAFGSGSSESHMNRRTRHVTRARFTPEEDEYLKELKGQNLVWTEIHKQFNYIFPDNLRTIGALQVRFSTKLRDR